MILTFTKHIWGQTRLVLVLETQRKKYAGYNMPFDYTEKIGAGLNNLVQDSKILPEI
jgi:hypothetical protein